MNRECACFACSIMYNNVFKFTFNFLNFLMDFWLAIIIIICHWNSEEGNGNWVWRTQLTWRRRERPCSQTVIVAVLLSHSKSIASYSVFQVSCQWEKLLYTEVISLFNWIGITIEYTVFFRGWLSMALGNRRWLRIHHTKPGTLGWSGL